MYTHKVIWKEKSKLTGIYVTKSFGILYNNVAQYRTIFERKLNYGEIASYKIELI